MKYLKVFTDFTRDIEPLSDAERGRLLTAMLLYAKDETDTDLKGNERFIWGLVKKNIDSQRESYKKICASAENARNALSEIRLKQTEADCRSTVSEQEYDKEQEKEQEKEKEQEEYITCTERQAASMPPVAFLPLNDGTEYGIKQDDIDHWKELYPSVDVEQEIRNMIGWLEGNKSRRKTRRGITAFITSWLSKEQDRGGRRKEPRSGMDYLRDMMEAEQ